MKDFHEYIHHIQEETTFILKAIHLKTFDDFEKDEILKRACVRSLEIIGEAVKQLPESETSKYPEIEWKKYRPDPGQIDPSLFRN